MSSHPRVAAPLLNVDETAASTVFDSLVSLGLVQQRRLNPPRYGLHGLVRALSVELLGTAATAELEQRYLETVLRLILVADERVDHAVATRVVYDAGDEPLLQATVDAAGAGAAWLEIELPVLQSAVDLAVRNWPRLRRPARRTPAWLSRGPRSPRGSQIHPPDRAGRDRGFR